MVVRIPWIRGSTEADRVERVSRWPTFSEPLLIEVP